MQQMIFIADFIACLFPHINDDARSKSLQIYRDILCREIGRYRDILRLEN